MDGVAWNGWMDWYRDGFFLHSLYFRIIFDSTATRFYALTTAITWLKGRASVFETEGCGFDSCRGLLLFHIFTISETWL